MASSRGNETFRLAMAADLARPIRSRLSNLSIPRGHCRYYYLREWETAVLQTIPCQGGGYYCRGQIRTLCRDCQGPPTI